MIFTFIIIVIVVHVIMIVILIEGRDTVRLALHSLPRHDGISLRGRRDAGAEVLWLSSA